MEDPVCERCGRTKSLCTCQKHRRHFDRCVAVMRYEDRAAKAVLDLKRHDEADRVETMAVEMVAALRRRVDAAAFDAVTCVPMHKNERRRRGFNQSEYLAKEIARLLDVPFYPALEKICETSPQKTLSRIERDGNLLGAYDVALSFQGERLLLVDDVITTGATLHECAKMLKIGGAASVTALVFAATMREDHKEESE